MVKLPLERQSLGLIDTLSVGFQTVNRRLWILAIPIVVDLFLWLGPQVSAAPVLDPLINGYNQLTAEALAQTSLTGDPGQEAVLAEQLAATDEQLRELSATSVATFLAGPALPGMDAPATRMLLSPVPLTVMSAPLPSLLKITGPAPGIGLPRYEVLVNSAPALVGVWALFTLSSLVLGALYLTGLGRAVRTSGDEAPFWPDALRGVGAMLALFLVTLAFLVVVMLPLMTVAGLLVLFVPAIGAAVAVLLFVIPLWTRVYFYFWEAAVFMGRQGVMAGALASFRVVQRSFWRSLLFIALVYFILVGVGILLHALLIHPLAVAAAIVVNAYIASGLIAAGMVFFRERLAAAPAPVPVRQH